MVSNTQSKPLTRTHGFSHHGRKKPRAMDMSKKRFLGCFFLCITENFVTFRLIRFSRNKSGENAAEFCGVIESIVSFVGSDEA